MERKIFQDGNKTEIVSRVEPNLNITTTLHKIRMGLPVRRNFFEFYASPGLGKSVLANELSQKCKKEDVFTSLIDFSEINIKQSIYDPTVILEKVVNDFKTQGHDPKLFREFDKSLKEFRRSKLPPEGVVTTYTEMDKETRLYQMPKWLKELKEVTIDFIELNNKAGKMSDPNKVKPVAIIMDQTDSLPIELKDWIEEWMVNPLIQIKHQLIVWTGDTAWRWKRPEIRRRLSLNKLEPFTIEQTKEQIKVDQPKDMSLTEMSEQIHALSSGNPQINNILIEEISKLKKAGHDITIENFGDYAGSLMHKTFDRFIIKNVLKGLPNNTCKAITYMSLPRLFDTNILSSVLKTVDPKLRSWGDEKFEDLMLKVKKSKLTRWEKGYSIDENVSNVIQTHFKLNYPKEFMRINRLVLNIYGEWLNRPIENRGLIVVEELYHTAILRTIKNDIDLKIKLKTRLNEYIVRYHGKKTIKHELEKLHTILSQDTDIEKYLHESEKENLLEVISQFNLKIN